jgi:uncharacterized RDD family membrane protein YckC
MERSESQANDSDQEVTESEGVATDSYASCKRRLGAFFLDWMIYSVFSDVLAYQLSRLGIERAEDWAFYVIGMLLYWIGFVALGVTPASWLCNIRIVDQRGRAPGLLRAFRRSLIPGTVWVLVAHGAVLFDSRIDAFYESNPIVEDFLFWGGGLVLMAYFVVYFYTLDSVPITPVFHDAIAGTQVIKFRGARKAALDRGFNSLRRTLGRVDPNPRYEESSTLRARHVNRTKEEV